MEYTFVTLSEYDRLFCAAASEVSELRDEMLYWRRGDWEECWERLRETGRSAVRNFTKTFQPYHPLLSSVKRSYAENALGRRGVNGRCSGTHEWNNRCGRSPVWTCIKV